MPKRIADKRLTDQNWNDPESDQEIPDEFKSKKADESVLKTRVIKKARRTMAPRTESSSVFSSFNVSAKSITSTGGFKLNVGNSKGFQMKGTGVGFSFGAKSNESEKPFSFNSKPVSEAKSAEVPPVKKELEEVAQAPKAPEVSALSEDASDTANKKMKKEVVSGKESSKQDKKSSLDDYNRHLTALNMSVYKWIDKHLKENPLVDLSPIFKDYGTHLKDIETRYNFDDTDDNDSVSPKSSYRSNSPSRMASLESSPTTSQLPSPERKTNFALSTEAPAVTPSTMMPVFKPSQSPPKNPLGDLFGKSKLASTAPKFTGFGFGSKSDSAAKTSTFSGFSFGNKPAAVSTTPTKDEGTANVVDEDAPPKVESVEVKEEGATFSKKCKLYYMKDEKFNDKGVGYLHLKPVPDTSKTQLIIRADLTIGTILLNVLLDPKMPAASKQGKNNVSFSCIPHPSIAGIPADKMVAFLFRVKTSDDADEVIDKINKMRKNDN